MVREPLARIECAPSQLATMIEYAALRSGDPEAHDAMFVRVSGDRIETPAASPDAAVKAYCTARSAMYDELAVYVDPPVDALFDIDGALDWLAWHGEDSLTVTLEGDPETGVADVVVQETADATVVLPCDVDWTYDDVALSLPDRFRDDHLVDEGGGPVATTVRTQASNWERLVAASDLAGTGDAYDVVVADGDLRLDLRGDRAEHVRGTIPATVEGPDVRRTVDGAFSRVVSALDGAVELQTGPAGPVAVVRDHEAYTLRFVVASA